MLKKCIKEINNELAMLDQLLNSNQVLFKKVKVSSPDRIELLALATILHSFYNGIENIFIRIAKRIDKKIPSSPYWHQELLKQMTLNIKERPAVISEKLFDKLSAYLGFRHFFRHSYSFNLRWKSISKLVKELEEVYSQFKKEISLFKNEIKKKL